MIKHIIRNKSDGSLICSDAIVSTSFFERLKGLMFIDDMNGFDGMLIEKCNSIHSCFMRFNIDVIFLDSDFKVIRVLRDFRPWRFSRVYFRASQVLELKSGQYNKTLKQGDELEVECIN